MELIRFDNFYFTYAGANSAALNGIDFGIESGEIVAVCGPSGCGKSTLINLCKEQVAPVGSRSGTLHIALRGDETAIVFQNPDTQTVATTVIHELAFQMENLGYDTVNMRKRIAETAGFFGLENLLHMEISALSGGQKQLVALCAAMATGPKLLLLDEPVSQLDPISCKQLTETLARINAELSVTIVIAEHRLDEMLQISDRIVFMDRGRAVHCGGVRETLKTLFASRNPEQAAFVTHAARASLTIDSERAAVSPKEFKAWFPSMGTQPKGVSGPPREEQGKPVAISARDVVFRYSKNDKPVIYNMSVSIREGERLCVLGGNGSGKTTFLKLLAGILKPAMGRINNPYKRIGYMPQNVRAYFVRERLCDEIDWTCAERVKKIAGALGVGHLLDRHPFDLSGGEMQKCALLAILSREPELILMDEPTKGMDPCVKTAIPRILDEFYGDATVTVVVATHDLEFAGGFSSRCGMFFDGGLAYSLPPREFFAGNNYYSTAVNKCVRHIDPNAVYYKDVLEIWGIEKPFYLEDYF